MSKVLKIVKDMQPLVIGLLILWVLMQRNSNSSFIESRERKFVQFSDSLSTVNDRLIDENLSKSKRIDTLALMNDSLDRRVMHLDEFISTKKKEYEKDRHTIRTLNADESIMLLSNNLSQRINN